MSISSSIKFLRMKYNLTQAELAKIAGVTDKAVSSWESGRADPRIGAVEKIAQHFNISKSEVISSDESDYSFSASEYTDEELELIEIYRSLNDEGRSFVEHIKDLLKSSPKYYLEDDSKAKGE